MSALCNRLFPRGGGRQFPQHVLVLPNLDRHLVSQSSIDFPGWRHIDLAAVIAGNQTISSRLSIAEAAA